MKFCTIIILMVNIVILLSFSEQKKREFIAQSIEINYSEKKSLFRENFIAHFPDKLTSPASVTHQEGSDDSSVGLFLNLQYNSTEIDSIVSATIKKSKANYKASDSCLMVVNRYVRLNDYGLTNSYKSDISLSKDCNSKDYLPFANFWSTGIRDLSTSCRLPADYDIYILDAKIGNYWNNLHRKSGRDMPDEWNHGYSKGISISEKDGSVMYWVVIW